MTDAPGGRTTTFLLTDIEESTRLWEERRDEMSVALEAHDRLLRAAVERSGGRVVKTMGDGLLAVFERAESALTAAVDGQHALDRHGWPATGPLRVRMAIHSGTAIQRRMAKSAAEELGPHLLGRKKPRADRRDFQMRDFLTSTKTLATSFSATTTLQDLANNPEFDFWSIFPEWNFIKGLRQAAPAPSPAPTPPGVTRKEWELLIQLDQSQTGHCVGFGSAQLH